MHTIAISEYMPVLDELEIDASVTTPTTYQLYKMLLNDWSVKFVIIVVTFVRLFGQFSAQRTGKTQQLKYRTTCIS